MTNILSRDKQTEIIAALCGGVSIRATSRLTGADRGTVMNLSVVVGRGCAALHQTFMRQLTVSRIELDEIWSYIGKKNGNRKDGDPKEVGDFYTFIAMAGDHSLPKREAERVQTHRSLS